ncbi:MAG: SDR family oxidoreductase [Oscillibacter sp.]|nr:SDR family oxidoreductase [Oscillibacter sp.]
MKSFEGRVAVVTGAAQGIGYAVAEKLIEEKISGIAILDWNADAIQAAAEKLSAATPETKVMPVQCDIADADAVDRAFAAIEATLGGIDILVNNAGITRDIMFHKMSFQQWDSVVKVNLYGTYNCCKAVMQGMRDRNYGRIVNLSSVVAYGNAGQVNYSATKGAIISMTKTLAKEGARRNITVNAIAPDCIDTAMMRAVPPAFLQDLLNRHPMQRLGKPEEVASLVAFLSNEECSYVSGTVIDCSGANRT